jgi:hypothetical protein
MIVKFANHFIHGLKYEVTNAQRYRGWQFLRDQRQRPHANGQDKSLIFRLIPETAPQHGGTKTTPRISFA